MKNKFKKDDLNKAVTLGVLLEYTDEVLIPRMSDLMDEKMDEKIQGSEKRMDARMDQKLAHLNYDLKEYIDKKMGIYTAEIFSRLDKKFNQEKQFRAKVVELFKKHRIGSPQDLAFLEGLAAGN